MNKERIEDLLSQLPLYGYFWIDPKDLEFSSRIRWICENECPMYGKSWACPPAVGSVDSCKAKCLVYQQCLMIVTMTEVSDIANIESAAKAYPTSVVMTTEKDSQRIKDCSGISESLKTKMFHAPIKAEFVSEGDKEIFFSLVKGRL